MNIKPKPFKVKCIYCNTLFKINSLNCKCPKCDKSHKEYNNIRVIYNPNKNKTL